MILSVVKDTLFFKTADGERYKFSLKPTLDVRVRGKDETVKKEINITVVALLGKVPDDLYTIEDAYAIKGYLNTWPECAEKVRPMKAIESYIKTLKEKARDAAIITMAEMYGSKIAIQFTEMIRRKRFQYPAYYLREAGVHELITCLLQIYPGAASAFNEVPLTSRHAITFAHRCGGSKCASSVKYIIQKHNLDNARCGAAFEAAHFIEREGW